LATAGQSLTIPAVTLRVLPESGHETQTEAFVLGKHSLPIFTCPGAVAI